MHPGSPRFVGATLENEALLLGCGHYRISRGSGLIWINCYAVICPEPRKVARNAQRRRWTKRRGRSGPQTTMPAVQTTRHDLPGSGASIARRYSMVQAMRMSAITKQPTLEAGPVLDEAAARVGVSETEAATDRSLGEINAELERLVLERTSSLAETNRLLLLKEQALRLAQHFGG